MATAEVVALALVEVARAADPEAAVRVAEAPVVVAAAATPEAAGAAECCSH